MNHRPTLPTNRTLIEPGCAPKALVWKHPLSFIRSFAHYKCCADVCLTEGLTTSVVLSITDRSNTHITAANRDGVGDAVSLSKQTIWVKTHNWKTQNVYNYSQGNAVSSSSVVAENDVTYSSVTVRPKTNAVSEFTRTCTEICTVM